MCKGVHLCEYVLMYVSFLINRSSQQFIPSSSFSLSLCLISSTSIDLFHIWCMACLPILNFILCFCFTVSLLFLLFHFSAFVSFGIGVVNWCWCWCCCCCCDGGYKWLLLSTYWHEPFFYRLALKYIFTCLNPFLLSLICRDIHIWLQMRSMATKTID